MSSFLYYLFKIHICNLSLKKREETLINKRIRKKNDGPHSTMDTKSGSLGCTIDESFGKPVKPKTVAVRPCSHLDPFYGCICEMRGFHDEIKVVLIVHEAHSFGA